MAFQLQSVHFIITNQCNLNCLHCFADSGVAGYEMTMDEIRKVLRELRELGVFQVLFTGGEPFCRNDFFEVLEDAEAMDFAMVIETNGTLLDGVRIRRLKNFSIVYVQIPFEGLENVNDTIRGDGNFKCSLSVIEQLTKNDIPVRARITATKKSLNDLYSLVSVLVLLGISSVTIREFVPLGRGGQFAHELLLDTHAKDEFANIIARIRSEFGSSMDIQATGIHNYLEGNGSSPCEAVKCRNLAILPDGCVNVCELFPFYCGNVRLQPLAHILENSPVIKSFRDFDRNRLTGHCAVCRFRNKCDGCRLFSFMFRGDIYAGDPLCYWACAENEPNSLVV
ncbi:radical SAM/SPASM domain-containing protein [Desulfobacca acetoxidans]